MNVNDPCLLSILHRGITKARTLSYEGKSEVAADLLDALDNIPRIIFLGREDYKDQLLEQLDTFDKQHPEHKSTGYKWMLENR